MLLLLRVGSLSWAMWKSGCKVLGNEEESEAVELGDAARPTTRHDDGDADGRGRRRAAAQHADLWAGGEGGVGGSWT